MAQTQVNLMFRAVSDETRLRILHLLLDGELCVGDLTTILKVPQPTASRHLAYLRRSGLEQKKPVRDQISDQVKQKIQRALCVLKESNHGLSEWHRVGPVGCYFCTQDWSWGFLTWESRTIKCQHLCQMGAG